MKNSIARLKDLLVRAWFEQLLRRGLVWFGFAALLLALGTGISLLFSLPLRIYAAFFLFLVSSLPVALLWPIQASSLGWALRSFDKESAIEAWLESADSPSCELLAQRAASRLEEVSHSPAPRRAPFRGLGRLYGAAAAALLILQVASLLYLGQPTLIYSGPPLRAGSGQRLDEQALDSQYADDPVARLALREGIESEEASGPESEGGESGGLGESSGKAKLGGSQPEGLGPGENASGDKAKGPAQDESQARGQSRELEAGDGVGAGGLPSEAGAGTELGSSTAERRPGAATGFEDGGASGVPSPLLDYRARIFKLLSERTKKETEASGELSLGELKDYERRYFASFDLSAGLGPVEEAYALLLKRRWRELRGQGK